MTSEMDCEWLSKGVVLKKAYQIRRKIAVSELSIVYLGNDLERNHPCVIKEFFPEKLVLRDLDHKTLVCKYPSLSEKYLIKREVFLHEAAILKTVRHKNIIGYLNDFVENNTGYIVTNYYRGKTLDKYMETETNISMVDFFKNIFVPLMDALNAMHKSGIIHRDIKPNNIIINSRNEPVIIDFGSAVNFQKNNKKDIFVTPGFSPLEFYSPTARQGRFSDIYSLAATLYYYLCGKAPQTAAERIIEDSVEDIRNYNRIISKMLATVIMKNLAVDYKKRFSSLNTFKLCIYLECLILKMKKAG